LLRAFGCAGFVGGGLGTVYAGVRVLSLPPDFWQRGGWDGRTLGLFLVAVLVGLLGMVIGWGIAAEIRVAGERADLAISVLWHCLANGSLIWLLLMAMVLQKACGREGCMELMQSVGEGPFTAGALGISAVGSLLIGGLWLLAGVVPLEGSPMALPCILLAAPVSVGMSYLAFATLGVESYLWILVAAVLPVGLLVACAVTIERDRVQRQQTLQRE